MNYLWIDSDSFGVSRLRNTRTLFSEGLAEVLAKAMRLRGVIRKIETRRDAQRMSEVIQCLPEVSIMILGTDAGATIKKFPIADAA